MAAWPSARGSVKEISVRPVATAETFCTIMSMLMPAPAMTRKIPAASPIRSGTPTTVTFASLTSCATPEIIGCSTSDSSTSSPAPASAVLSWPVSVLWPAWPLTQVPILLLNEERTWIGTS